MTFNEWWELNYAHFGTIDPGVKQVALDAWIESRAALELPADDGEEEIKPLSIVKLTEHGEQYNGNRFHRDDFQFVYLGEIPNMLGHVVVVGWSTGKFYAGFHPENFRLLRDDE